MKVIVISNQLEEKHYEMFCEDLKNYADGKPLQHVVDRNRGY